MFFYFISFFRLKRKRQEQNIHSIKTQRHSKEIQLSFLPVPDVCVYIYIHIYKIKRKKTKLDVLLFSPLLISLNPTVLMITLCHFFLLTIKVVQDASSLISLFLFWISKILRRKQESIK